MKNKKAMSIPIVLLVFATLILTIFSLFIFATKDNETKTLVSYASLLEDLYSREEITNFYISEILEEIQVTEDETLFIQNFKKELDKYRFKDGKFPDSILSDLYLQINEENIVIENKEGNFLITFTIKVENQEKEISADHNYKRTFEKPI